MKLPKELKAWRKLALAQGWRVEPTKNGHVLFLSPDGARVVVAGTASDWRSHRNARSLLRRAGLKGV